MSGALAIDLHEDLQGLIGSTIAERYRIDGLIGVGGMGAVFRGHHLGLKRDVAIKILHPELTRDADISARFDREAHSASRLDHPNCLQVTDYGSTAEGMKFMVMQLLEGKELTARLGKPLLPATAAAMLLQILRGLEHAHGQGVIHRDLKPENVFVTEDHDGRETLKLVDFGIAKIVSGDDAQEKMTKVGLVFGTPQYMSPEQATGMEIDERTDIYSAGILLYQMLCGELPFVHDDPVAVVRMQVSKDPPPLPNDIPAELDTIVGKMLAKQRDQRYASARAVCEAVERALPTLETAPISVGDSGGRDRSSSVMTTAKLAPKSSSRRLILGGLVVAAVVAGYVWWPAAEAPTGAGATDAQVTAPGEPAAEPDELLVTDDGPPADRLAEIAQLVAAGNIIEARKLLQPLRDQFPHDPRLLWLQGRTLAKSRKKRAEALLSYREALEQDPSLLDNQQFYDELLELMRVGKLREEALNIALRKMGDHGHPFLLELVNREKRALGFDDRHRALEQLASKPENEERINQELNTGLDLRQAHQSLTPCQSYAAALDSIEAKPDAVYVPPLAETTAPEPRTDDTAVEGDAAKCEGLEKRRVALLAKLRKQFQIPEPPPVEEPPASAPAKKKSAPKKKSSSKKKSSKPKPKPKKKCDRFKDIFKKDCWK